MELTKVTPTAAVNAGMPGRAAGLVTGWSVLAALIAAALVALILAAFALLGTEALGIGLLRGLMWSLFLLAPQPSFLPFQPFHLPAMQAYGSGTERESQHGIKVY